MTRKRTPTPQFAALPYRRRRDGGVEIMLVTSRGTGRWIIPKGWPVEGLTPHAAAAKEALEEGGIIGRIRPQAIGSYQYDKQRGAAVLVCEVAVFALEVAEQLPEWPEQHQRRTRWFSAKDAAAAVQEQELSALIRALADLVREPA